MVRKCFKIFGVLALALALVFRPDSAYAWDFIYRGVLYQGVIDADYGTNLYGAVVSAYNEYDAACYVMGTNPDTLSASVKQKLSDASYGGKFYEYAQTFFTQSGALSEIPPWVPTYVVMVGELSDLLLADYQAVWYSSASKTLHDYALQDFKRVLAGEDLSGGSGSSSVVSFPVTVNSNDIWFGANIKVSNFSVSSATQFVFNIVPTSTVINFINSHIEQYPYFYVVVSAYGSEFNYNRNNFNTVLVDYFLSDHVLSTSINGNSHWIGSNTNVYHAQHKYVVAKNGVTTCSWSNTPSLGPAGQTRSSAMWVKRVTGVDPPAGVWPEPETPVTPTAPEIPTPTGPTAEPDPVVTEPVVTWPDVTITITPTPDTTDYSELLTAINNNLNSLRSDLITEFDSVETGLRNIYTYLQHLDDLLERHCKHLRDALDDAVYNLELYLKRLFEWLPQQLDFDFDDSDIRYLLRRIMNKIPGGSTPVTYKPNPQSDEPGFFDWLTDLWQRFLIDLVSVLPDQLGGLVDTLSQLTHYFPFSIPWDLFALLSLFAHEPVTPVFDVPLPYTSEDSATVHVDLSAWDPVAAMMRPCFLAIFCLKLALLTRDLLSGFDLSKGGV